MGRAENPRSSARVERPRLLLVGNPNVGKSVFFHLLTGRYVVVSNYPGTTVELSRGEWRVAGRVMEVIDTPGANSLSPNSDDERVARDVVLAGGERVVVQIADAKNVRRALMLTAQLAELEVPCVVALNMWDEAQDRGLEIDAARLGDALGVPVVPTVATERWGVLRLFSSVGEARPPRLLPRYGPAIEEAVAQLTGLLPAGVAGRRGLALMLLTGSPGLEEALAPRAAPGFAGSLDRIRAGAGARLREPLALVIQRRRAAEADALVASVVRRTVKAGRTTGFWRAAFFLALGPALFFLVGWRLACFALFTFSRGEPRFGALGWVGSALAAQAAGYASLFLFSRSMWRREYAGGGTARGALARVSTHPVGGALLLVFVLWLMYEVVGVFGAGTCVNFMEREVLGVAAADTGEYGGWVNGPLSRAVGGVTGRESMVYAILFDRTAGLVSKGLTYAVAIVLPIVTLFFLAFSLMEDTGYLPRLSLLADRLFKRVGLSGKAVLPMVLGFGCGTMATMTTRILEGRRQRLIAVLLLALAVPCSAQLGIITAILAKVSAAGVLLYVSVLAVVLFVVGKAAAWVIPGDAPDLLIEVPPFRWPQARNVVMKTAHRVGWFLREAVPLFLLGTACLFAAERTGVLAAVERAASPVVSGLLGLPKETTRGFILGFLRRDYGTVIIFDQFQQGLVGAEQAVVALVVITLFVPCLAHFFVCVKELGWRRAVLVDAVVFVVALVVGALVRVFIAATGIHIGPSG